MGDVLYLDPSEPGADARMISTPDLWPMGRVLALTRIAPDEFSGRELGVMVIGGGVARWRVFGISPADRRLLGLLRDGEAEASVAVHDYADAEAIVEAGWRID